MNPLKLLLGINFLEDGRIRLFLMYFSTFVYCSYYKLVPQFAILLFTTHFIDIFINFIEWILSFLVNSIEFDSWRFFKRKLQSLMFYIFVLDQGGGESVTMFQLCFVVYFFMGELPNMFRLFPLTPEFNEFVTFIVYSLICQVFDNDTNTGVKMQEHLITAYAIYYAIRYFFGTSIKMAVAFASLIVWIGATGYFGMVTKIFPITLGMFLSSLIFRFIVFILKWKEWVPLIVTFSFEVKSQDELNANHFLVLFWALWINAELAYINNCGSQK